jgi:mannose/fructose/N-acetylgalactosamine-specific phosphotransferase system component IIB
LGLTTFGSNVDINADLDVDGRTELDDLNVSGVSTFASNVDINAGLDVDGHTELDNLNVTGVATFTSNVNISTGELHGPAEFIIDPAAVGDNTGLVRIKGDLYVDGTTTQINSTTIEFADFNVGIATTVGTNLLLDGAGISIGSASVEKTFTYNNSANTLESSIGLGVTTGGDFKTGTDSVLNRTTLGPTVVNSSLTSVGTLTEVEVSGISTFASDVDINASVDISTNLVVDGLSDLDELNVAGISTFASDLDINASVDISNNLVVDGLSDLDELNVAGISTFQNNIEVTGNIEFDNITTTGAATATLTTLTETPIHTGLSASTYRSVEYTIQATEGTNFHSAKVLVVHDGTTAYHSEYGTIYNNTPVATFNADVSGGNLRLLAAGESSNSTVYKIHFIATKV